MLPVHGALNLFHFLANSVAAPCEVITQGSSTRNPQVSTATINLKLGVVRWESATMGRQAMKTFISALLLLQVRLLSLF